MLKVTIRNFFYEFLPNLTPPLTLDIDKTSALLEIAGLSDLEIHLLVSSHKEFLDSIDNNLNDFMKISQAATAIKEIERKILEIKNKS